MRETIKKYHSNYLVIIFTLFYLIILFYLLRNSYSYLDPDLGWHLSVGQEISQEQSLPKIIKHNFVLAGENWVDHEWLMNLVVYLLYKNFGYLVVNIFFALIVVLTLIILTVTVYKFTQVKNTFYILILQLLGVLGMAPHLGVRLQEITILNLALLLYILFHYNKYKNYQILFYLLPLFYFWANSHAGFLIGLFVLFFWLTVKSIELLLTKIKNKWYFIDFSQLLASKELLIFFIFSLASFGVTLITPYQFSIYSFLTSYSNTYYLLHIQEWLPFYYLPVEYKKLVYYALLVVTLFLLVYSSLKKKKEEITNEKTEEYKINLWLLLSSTLFLFLAAKSNRHFPLLFIISFPLLVGFSSKYLYLEKDFIKQYFGRFIYLIYFYLMAGLLLAAISNFIKTNFITDPFFSFCSTYPCGAVRFLTNHPEENKLKLFNEFDFGGYLIWLLPEEQLFIDGRFPQYLVNQQTILQEYDEFFKPGKAEEKLKQYDVETVLLKKEKPLKLSWFEKHLLLINLTGVKKYKNNLEEYLQSAKNWSKIYDDANSSIYVKKSES